MNTQKAIAKRALAIITLQEKLHKKLVILPEKHAKEKEMLLAKEKEEAVKKKEVTEAKEKKRRSDTANKGYRTKTMHY